MALGIINFLGKSKEKETLDMMREHVKIVVEVKDAYLEAYDAYRKNNQEKAEIKAGEVSAKEHEADLVCKKIIKNLYEGAFLPNMRSNIYSTVEEIDTVADKIKNAANMLPYMKVVKLNKDLKAILDELCECVSKGVDDLQRTVDAFLKGDDKKFKENVDAVKRIEEEADRAQKLMYDELIYGKHDAKTLHVVSAFGHFMATVTDAADNTCDAMELLKILMQI